MIMGEKKMENEKSEHVQGRPWKVEAKLKTFEEADKLRESLKNSENPPDEVKVKLLSSSGLFVVKTRRKEEKKKNKKQK